MSEQHQTTYFADTPKQYMIAREGWEILGGAVLLALGITLIANWVIAVPFWLLVIFVLQFFRDPPRVIPEVEGAILAPADGRVIAIEETFDPYLHRNALKISVFMNVFNVHSNRIPYTGEIKYLWYNRGQFLNASLDKASLENERCALWIQTPDNKQITCVQVAGLVARRILYYVQPGDKVAAGQRYGFIRFGSRVDLYLPVEAKPLVQIDDKVTSAETILAMITDNKNIEQ